MNKIKFVSDSSCDLTPEEVSQLDISIVPFNVSFDDVHYLREGVDIQLEEFYEKLKEPDAFAKTSLPSINDYVDTFTTAIKNGEDILCFTITSKFSGSYQSAITAKDIVLEEYPDATIIIVDSYNVTRAQGNLIRFCHSFIEKGKTIQEIEQIALKNRLNSEIYFTVSTLKYLQKGGRIGKGTALVGEFLNVNPIMSMSDGEIQPIGKVRGRKKALQTISQKAQDFAKGKTITYVSCLSVGPTEDQTTLVKKCEELGFENITTGNVGITISAHIGNTVIGVLVSCFEE